MSKALKLSLIIIAGALIASLFTSSCGKRNDWVCSCNFDTTGVKTNMLNDLKRREAQKVCDTFGTSLDLQGTCELRLY